MIVLSKVGNYCTVVCNTRSVPIFCMFLLHRRRTGHSGAPRWNTQKDRLTVSPAMGDERADSAAVSDETEAPERVKRLGAEGGSVRGRERGCGWLFLVL